MHSIRQIGVLVTAAGIVAVAIHGGCFTDLSSLECPPEQRDIDPVNVAGTFRYDGMGRNAQSGRRFRLTGTITFEQAGRQVRVIDTTYDAADLRRVAGDFEELEGNTLFTVLRSFTGANEYVAAVRFVFSPDGGQFCVSFLDSNNDSGEFGSFRGIRVE